MNREGGTDRRTDWAGGGAPGPDVERMRLLLRLLLPLALVVAAREVEVDESGDVLDRIEQRRLLTELYTKLGDDEKIEKIDQLLDHFSRRYDVMWNILQKKYSREAKDVLRAHAENVEKKMRARAEARKKAKKKADARASAAAGAGAAAASGDITSSRGEEGNKKKSKRKGITIVTAPPPVHMRKRRKKKKKKEHAPFPWEAGDGREKSMHEQQEEMEQELLDFFSLIAPDKTDTVEKVVMEYFDRRSELEDILLRRHFRRSVHLWSTNGGGLGKAVAETELLSPTAVEQAETTKQYELLKAVNAFYEVVRPEFRGDHSKETVMRWHSFPSELVDRLVRRYLPSSAFRWMKRRQRRVEEIEEELRLKAQLEGYVTEVDAFLADGKAEQKAKQWSI